MRRLCVFPNDSLQHSLVKGEVKPRYFNPGDLFDEIHVISLADEETKAEVVQEMAGRARLVLHTLGSITAGTLTGLPAYRRRVLDRIRAIRPAAVRAYNPFFPGWLAVSCAQALDVPSVVSLHGNFDKDVRELYWREGRFLRWLKYTAFAFTVEPYVLRHADKVICAYQFPVEYARRYGAKDAAVIYNRVDLERFAPSPRSGLAGELKVLAVGRLVAEKNHACLLRALAVAEGVRLRIVGDGPEHAALSRLAGRLGLEGRLELARSVPHRDIHREYQWADVYATAIRYGGVSIPVMEAMASGLPLVVPTPRWEPEPELAAPAALVVENTPAAFRQAFLRLRDDPALRQRLGRLARERIAPLGAAEMEARERRVYEELLDLERSGVPQDRIAVGSGASQR